MTTANPSIRVTARTTCAICGSAHLRRLHEFPSYPLTGIFVSPEEATPERYPLFDQALLQCEDCGHGQLLNSIDPAYLYRDTYTHRTGGSPIASRGNDYFFNYIRSIVGDRKFEGLVEIGCNDLYLIRKFAGIARQRWGVDPVWDGAPNHERDGAIINGSFLENIVPSRDIPFRPDLVISTSTLEHVENPMLGLRAIYDHAADGCLFFVEVPSFDSLLLTHRLDQVFHQHLNYYSAGSFLNLIRQLGASYIHHSHNYGYWHGNLLIAFRKAAGGTFPVLPPPSLPYIERQFATTHRLLDGCRETLENLHAEGKRLYGFGAAQMLPVFAYLLGTDLRDFECILDDNTDKDGRVYPHLPVRIRHTAGFSGYADGSFLVTALDSYRTIGPRLMSLGARDIIFPFPIQ